jgi:hypothetical protein
MTLRRAHALLALAALAAGGAVVDAPPAAAVCRVCDRHPCHPTFCSVFQRRPCIPEIEYPLGQDLRLTIEAEDNGENALVGARQDLDHPRVDRAKADSSSADGKLDTLTALFEALRGCWVPPPRDAARPGMQMSVRFSLKRSGEIIGTPRVTYATRDTSPELRETYHDAITAALARCTPLPLSAGLGGAVAGRPIAIRFVDNRTMQAGAP